MRTQLCGQRVSNLATLESITAKRELERRGLTEQVETRILKAKFYLPTDADERKISGEVQKNTRKYLKKLQMSGWEVNDLPVCRKVRLIDEKQINSSHLYIPNSVGVWHEAMLAAENTIPEDHPFVRPGQDLYIIWVKAQRLAQAGVMEIDDEVLEGMVDRDDDTLDGIVIH